MAEDPADERDRLRAAITLGQLCDFYLEAAEAGLVLGRKGRAEEDEHGLERPLAHRRSRKAPARSLQNWRDHARDIETFKRDVVLGKTAKDQKLGFRKRSIVKGGKGVVTRTIGMLGAVFACGQENG